MPNQGKITERTLYPPIVALIKQFGGSGIVEVTFDSESDIVFDCELPLAIARGFLLQ